MPKPDDAALRGLLDFQDGVITRRQVLAAGWTDGQVRGRLRRRQWVPIYPGVYLTHTGTISWRQRAWAAVLDAAPAALCHGSALRAAGATKLDDGLIHIEVARHRRVTRRPGVVVHYRTHRTDRLLWTTRPPRARVEEALIDMAAEVSTEFAAVAILTDAVGQRITTADRLLVEAVGRSRLRRRSLLEEVLIDVRDGTCSVLEHGYRVRVERAHGLPTPQRQAPTTVGRPGFRDVDYPEFGLIIELDGRPGHSDGTDRDRDLERDLDAAVDADKLTLRLGWGQVIGRACTTARKVGRVLTARGWSGTVTRCGACPPAP